MTSETVGGVRSAGRCIGASVGLPDMQVRAAGGELLTFVNGHVFVVMRSS